MNDYGILVHPNGTMEISKITGSVMNYARNLIGCEWVERVNPRYLLNPLCFLCDEEFLLKDHPMEINFIGSGLYDGMILGKIVIVKMIMTNDGPDLAGLTWEEANEFVFKITVAIIESKED